MKCEVPPLPVHARLKGAAGTRTEVPFKGSIEYVCDTGYVLTGGDLVRLCLVTEKWTGKPPQCQGMCKTLLILYIKYPRVQLLVETPPYVLVVMTNFRIRM